MTEPVYLDYAATTPVRNEVLEAMLPYLDHRTFGNPSSAHRFGRTARAAIEEAKRRIAQALGAEPQEVIFTSGGTEADNLAVLGTCLAAAREGMHPRAAVGSTEHKAVMEAAQAVQDLGGDRALLRVEVTGALDWQAFEHELHNRPTLVSVMWVNNEVGTVQDVEQLASRCREAGVPFHTDAVQAVGKLPVDLHRIPEAMVSISAHKIGGPKGAGALIVRDRTRLTSMLKGGGQQFGVRPGTENVPGIVGLARAVELAVGEQEKSAQHMAALRDDLERRLSASVSDLQIIGTGTGRAPHISCAVVRGAASDVLTMHLDLAGIACSAGSACNTGAVKPSHVLTAMGIPEDEAVASLRFSFSKANTPADLDRVAAELPRAVERVRNLEAALD